MFRKRSQFKCVIQTVQEVRQATGKVTLHLQYVTNDRQIGHLVLSIDESGLDQLAKDVAQDKVMALGVHLTGKKVDIQFQ